MSKLRKAWILFGVLVAALVGIPVLVWQDAARRADRVIEQNRQDLDLRIRRLRSLPARGRGTPGNGWPRLAKALADIKAFPDIEAAKFPRISDADPPPPPDPAVLDPVLDALRPALAEVSAALGHAEMEPGYAYEEGAAMLLPETSPAIRLSKMLADAARMRMDQGRRAEAVDWILLGLRLSHAIPSKGVLVSRLVGLVGMRLMMEELERFLNANGLTAAEAESLAKGLEGMRHWTDDPATAWEPEGVVARAAVLEVARHGGAEGLGANLTSPRHFFSVRIMAAEALNFLDRYEADLAAALKKGPVDRRAHLAALERKTVTSRNPIIGALMPAVSRCHLQLLEEEARMGLAKAAVALRRHALVKGSAPARLEDLVPEFLPGVPVDPFGGSPLKLAVGTGGFLLYSVGPDLDDDGGRAAADPSDASADGDLVWTVRGR